MSISLKITKALDDKDIDSFISLSNHPALLINDIYDNGLLNYMLEKYPQHPITYYKVIIENVNIDVNKLNSAGLSPFLQTNNIDILKLLLDNPRRNIDKAEIFASLIDKKLLGKEWIQTNVFKTPPQLFYDMLKHLKYDTINLVLDMYPETFPKDILNNTELYKPAEELITNSKTDIIGKLVSIGCSLPESAIIKLIELNETDIIKDLIIVGKADITIPSLVLILRTFKNNSDVIKPIVTNNIKYKLIDTLKIFMKDEPEMVFTIINVVPDVLYIIIDEMFINLNNDYRDRLLEIVKSDAKIKEYIIINRMEIMLLNVSIETNNRDLLLYLIEHIDIFEHEHKHVYISILDYISYEDTPIIPSKLLIDNIDNMLKIPGIAVNDLLQTVIDVFINNNNSDINKECNKIYNKINLYEKIVAHPNFNIDYGVDDFEYNIKHSYLYYMVNSFINSDTDLDHTKMLSMYRTLLAHPNIDVNAFCERYIENIFDKILKYDETVEYASEEHFMLYPALLNDLIRHPKFNININNKLIQCVLSSGFTGLLNRILSMPEMDINNMYLLHHACNIKNEPLIRQLLTIGNINVNIKDSNGLTPLHLCINSKYTPGSLILLDDPRIDLSITDSKGRNYIRLSNKAGMDNLSEVLASKGQTDDKKTRVDREVAEYNARMTQLGRRKEGRIRETLNNFDLILKEREHILYAEDSDGFSRNETPYSLTICPFCLTYLEKDNLYECIYLSGHVCPLEIQNEELKRLYFGDNWQTAVFEICCTCGRPCSHHGHYKPVSLDGDETSSLLPNGELANHWRCDEHNGGGDKFEMVVRLVGMLTELKARVDRDIRLVYGPELIKELAAIANRSLFDYSIIDRSASILRSKKWNVNSKIPKYAKFNAPNVIVGAESITPMIREHITHFSNVGREDKLQCMICLDDEADDVFKPHLDDNGYICSDCIKRQVCASRYASVTCALGCVPAKQIYKEDVDALMGGNFCEGVQEAEVAANED